MVLASLGAAALAAPVSAAEAYFPTLTGDQEVPGPGDADGDGSARIAIDPAGGTVCVEWFIDGIATATAAHIHSGAAGVAGPVVVALPEPDADGAGGDCATGLDEATLLGIVADPESFYVNVHNADFPGGAVRGQLGEAIEYVQLSVGFLACEEGTVVAEATDGCVPIIPQGNLDPAPPGYSYDPAPIEFDLEIEVDDGVDVLTELDGEISGGGTCNPATMTCSIGFGYEYSLIFSGDTAITQLTIPDGFELAGAAIFVDGTFDSVVAATGDSVIVDTTGADNITVRLYDIAVTAAATPTPTPPPGAGSIAPTTYSPPPTDTDRAAASEAAAAVPFLLVVASICVLAMAAAGVRRRTGA